MTSLIVDGHMTIVTNACSTRSWVPGLQLFRLMRVPATLLLRHQLPPAMAIMGVCLDLGTTFLHVVAQSGIVSNVVSSIVAVADGLVPPPSALSRLYAKLEGRIIRPGGALFVVCVCSNFYPAVLGHLSQVDGFQLPELHYGTRIMGDQRFAGGMTQKALIAHMYVVAHRVFAWHCRRVGSGQRRGTQAPHGLEHVEQVALQL